MNEESQAHCKFMTKDLETTASSPFFDRCVPLCNVQRLHVIKVRFPTGSDASLLR